MSAVTLSGVCDCFDLSIDHLQKVGMLIAAVNAAKLGSGPMHERTLGEPDLKSTLEIPASEAQSDSEMQAITDNNSHTLHCQKKSMNNLSLRLACGTHSVSATAPF